MYSCKEKSQCQPRGTASRAGSKNKKRKQGKLQKSIDGDISGWQNTFTTEPDPEDRDSELDSMNPILRFSDM